MTTEVLRNMIYARSGALDRLGVVVLDEVHYLQDTYRGPVWEEVIIHLPARRARWCACRPPCRTPRSWPTGSRRCEARRRRSSRSAARSSLENLYLVGDKTSDRLHLLPTLVDGRPNPEAARLDDEAVRGWRGGGSQRPRPAAGSTRPAGSRWSSASTPRAMLPAIYFIFSRNACDEAAQTCLDAGLRLTTGPERDRIREIVDERLGALDDHDLAVLGYGRSSPRLEDGHRRPPRRHGAAVQGGGRGRASSRGS